MPIYEFRCLKCERLFEVKQNYEDKYPNCPDCGSKVKRLVSVVNHKKAIEG